MTNAVAEELKEQIERQKRWEALSQEEKKHQLFLRQVRMLGLFLERNAISKAQYDKSLGDMRRRMGYPEPV